MSQDDQKKRAAEAAATYVKNGMVLGLGTGSTAAHLVRCIGARAREGLMVRAIPTSEITRRQALAEGIELVEPDESTRIDLVIDGADEIDSDRNLIKGGGGALLREKIIAAAGAQMIVIADAGKQVAQLGAFALPVEVDRFAWPLSVQAIRSVLAAQRLEGATLALRPGLREDGGGVFLSDGGNYIVDIHCGRIEAASQLDSALRAIPGVVETGLFVNLASIVILGTDDGVKVLD